MSYKIVYTEEAEQDLVNIYGYIAMNLLAPETAKKQIDRIMNAIKLDVSELIMKRHVSLFDEYWVFDPNGEYLGKVRPRVSWFAYPLFFLLRGGLVFSTFFGLVYNIMDADDKLIGQFRMGKGLKTVVNIYDTGHQLIGTYRQNDWKSLFDIHGELCTGDNQKILDAKVRGFSGNFKLTDISGLLFGKIAIGKPSPLFKGEGNRNIFFV